MEFQPTNELRWFRHYGSYAGYGTPVLQQRWVKPEVEGCCKGEEEWRSVQVVLGKLRS